MQNQEILEQVIKLIINHFKREENHVVNLFINSHDAKQKQLIINSLSEKRKKYIEDGDLDEAEFLSRFLEEPLSENEIEFIWKSKIKNNFGNPSSYLDEVIKWFPDKEKTYFLQLFMDADLLHSSIKVAKKLELKLPESFVKKQFKKALEEGYLSNLKIILDHIEEESGKERKLSLKEKGIFVSNAKIYSLEDFLDYETFLQMPLDTKLLLDVRKKSLSGVSCKDAMILSKMTGKILKREELVSILERIYSNFYSFTNNNKKEDIKKLENLLPKKVIKEIKEKSFRNYLESSHISAVKFLAEELGVKLSVEDYKIMIKNQILKQDNKGVLDEIFNEMKKDFPKEAKDMEKLN